MKKISRKTTYTLGLDLGGTKLAAALVDSKGKILAFYKQSILDLKTDPKKGPELITDLMIRISLQFKEQFPQCFTRSVFAGIGLASAGPLNVETGELTYPVNFPKWKIVPIQKMLATKAKKAGLGAIVAFQNDAIAASRAEGWTGAARGLESFAVVTIGTGIGSGVIFRHQPVQTKGMGSEFGHVIARADQIRSAEDLPHWTIEGLASGTGILRRAKDMGFVGNSIEDLVAALDQGESQYQVLFDDAADTLAALCYDLSIGFHLDKILFSGGLIKVRRLYWGRLNKRYKELIHQFNPKFACRLQVAQHLNQAGVLGAASLPYHLS